MQSAPVGTLRYLRTAVPLGTLGMALIVCGAIHGHVVLGLGVVLASRGLYWLTRPDRHPDRPAARMGVWLAWGLALVPWLVEMPRVQAQLMQLPLLASLGWLVLTHARPETELRGRVQLDLVGVVLTALPLLVLTMVDAREWAHPPSGPFVHTAVAWVGGLLVLLVHGLTTLAQLEPGARHPLWDRVARERGWATEERGESWWRAVGPGARGPVVTVELDPVPACARMVLQLPELRGLSVSKRRSDSPAGLSLGDPVLDAHLHVQGDRGLAMAVLPRARELWLQVIHGWGGTLRDGTLALELEGAPDDDGLQQVLAALAELSELAGEGRAELAPPAQRARQRADALG
jgi:hypothetical protein